MALSTSNIYGNITIYDNVIYKIVGSTALKCYGVYSLVSRRISDSILSLFGKEPISKGVKVLTSENKTYIEVYVLLKSGVNKEAVVESLKSSIIYNIEHITGMIVKSVNIHVVGVRL
ncbi:MAG TPA: Asp23/Gls24 family envelope stress response protein [Clostridiales bacterium]|nr:Asp23/Gls24 family envelope stress response protein [Clostridiales bacterium]